MAHVSLEELSRHLAEAARQVEVGARYSHYKDPSKHYLVKGFGILEATEEVGVIYEAQYGDRIVFIRPLSSWLAAVETEGNFVPRFSKI